MEEEKVPFLRKLLDVLMNSRGRWEILFDPEFERYYEFEIPKKREGEFRQIQAPSEEFMPFLRELYESLNESFQPTLCSHGFVKDKSIVTNAEPHVGKPWALNLDLKDFFPSITEKRVYGAILAWRKLCRKWDIGKQEAFLLARFCCHQNRLPQGSPTSPLLSNLVARGLDVDLMRFAKSRRLIYSRYADDLTFSPLDARVVPESVMSSDLIYPDERLVEIIEKNGFSVNPPKTRLQRAPCSIRVTGLVVNQTVNVPRKMIRQVRAMLNAWEKYGKEAAGRNFIKIHKVLSPFDRVVWGKIQFIGMVRGKGDPVYLKLRKRLIEQAGYFEPSLKVDLEDVRVRSDLNLLEHEDRNWKKWESEVRKGLEYRNGKKAPPHGSYLNSWVEARVDYLVGGLSKLRKEYRNCSLLELVFAAEKTFLLNTLSRVENHRDVFSLFVTAWNRIVSQMGDDVGPVFAQLPFSLAEANQQLPLRLERFFIEENNISEFKLAKKDGEFVKGTFKSIRAGAGDPKQRGQGLGALMLWVGLSLIEGSEDTVIKRQQKRVRKTASLEPEFASLFNSLRKARNSDKRPGFYDVEHFRDCFFRAWKAFGARLN